MTEAEAGGLTGGGTEAASGSPGTGWIKDEKIPTVVGRVRAIREINTAQAVRDLGIFAHDRDIDHLLTLEPEASADSAGNFDRLDATIVLALAALTRPVDEAARLAIGRWEKGRDDRIQARLAESIVHDIIAQRTVSHVADFVRACRQRGHGDLIQHTLQTFVGAGSGRTNLDKALLYIELSDDKRCAADATALLRLTLAEAAARARAIGTRDHIVAARNHLGPARGMTKRLVDALLWLSLTLVNAGARTRAAGAPDGGERDGIVAALHHLSPSQPIVAHWFDQELQDDTKNDEDTIKLACDLLAGEPVGARPLAEYVGRHWDPDDLGELCQRLVKRSPQCLRTVREHAAKRDDGKRLAKIIQFWCDSGPLSRTLKDLLADIVASGEVSKDGSRSPRDFGFLDDSLLTNLRRKRKRYRVVLQVAIAAHTDGRFGEDIAKRLGQVEGRRNVKRAAQAVNKGLADELFQAAKGKDNSIEKLKARYIDYLANLGKLGERGRALTFWAVRELSHWCAPRSSMEIMAPVVADIAALAFEKRALREAGFDLLERCLENEQALTPEAAATIVKQVDGHHNDMRANHRWSSLFGATIGRWAEVDGRKGVIDEFYLQGFSAEREAIIGWVQ